MTALILLAYTLIRIAELPTIAPEIAVAGLVIRFEINIRLIMLTLTAALAAAGSDWLLRTHPRCESGRKTSEHWILPGLASFGLGAILTRLPEGLGLWLGLPIAALLLTAVLVAEFIVFDRQDPRYDFVELILRTLAYLLLAGSLFALNGSGLRAIFAVPLTFAAAALVSWRLMRLESVFSGAALRYAILIGMVAAQLGLTLLASSPTAGRTNQRSQRLPELSFRWTDPQGRNGTGEAARDLNCWTGWAPGDRAYRLRSPVRRFRLPPRYPASLSIQRAVPRRLVSA
jgi:hypothetical protein